MTLCYNESSYGKGDLYYESKGRRRKDRFGGQLCPYPGGGPQKAGAAGGRRGDHRFHPARGLSGPAGDGGGGGRLPHFGKSQRKLSKRNRKIGKNTVEMYLPPGYNNTDWNETLSGYYRMTQ